jgi:hypothetical protein
VHLPVGEQSQQPRAAGGAQLIGLLATSYPLARNWAIMSWPSVRLPPGDSIGRKKSRPPPSRTSGSSARYWSTMPWLSPRVRTCTLNAAGLASQMAVVVTSPIRLPAALAASMRVPTGWPSGPTPTEPLRVLTPVPIAVPAAAESVTSASKG